MVSFETAQFPGFTRSREGSMSEVQTGYQTWNVSDGSKTTVMEKDKIGGKTNAVDGVATLDEKFVEFLC